MPESAAAIVVATKEAWAQIDSAGQQFVNNLLNEAVGRVLDARLFAAPEAINEALKCVLPLINYCLRLDARLSALECRERARAEIGEARN
ncbi:MAG: hypothetical protein QM682_17500 [Paracoccus sp. (in: a-proteobacteria)]|uniref:hypothetical protein n=1 Tax=Paracoccus sp. TaxID=267 RepID=UPI0039E214C1